MDASSLALCHIHVLLMCLQAAKSSPWKASVAGRATAVVKTKTEFEEPLSK